HRGSPSRRKPAATPCRRRRTLLAKRHRARQLRETHLSGQSEKTFWRSLSAAQKGSVGLVGQCLDQVENLLAHLRVANADEGAIELETFRAAQKIDHVTGAVGFRESAGAILARSILEEERDRHVEYRRNRLQAARADAVRALLIFLDLLECDAEQLSELLLAHAEHVAAQPDATADVHVYWIWFLLVFIHRISCPGKAGRQTVRSFYLETRLEPQIRTTALTQVYRLFHYDLLIYCVSIDTRGRTQAGNDPDRHQKRNHKPTNDFGSCNAQRVGASQRQRNVERADAVEFQRVHDPTERIDRRRDAVVGGAQHRQAGLDRAKLGLAQMLVRSGRVAEPRVVG